MGTHLAGEFAVVEVSGYSSCWGLEGWENYYGELATVALQNHFAADVEPEDGGKEVAYPQ